MEIRSIFTPPKLFPSNDQSNSKTHNLDSECLSRLEYAHNLIFTYTPGNSAAFYFTPRIIIEEFKKQLLQKGITNDGYYYYGSLANYIYNNSFLQEYKVAIKVDNQADFLVAKKTLSDLLQQTVRNPSIPIDVYENSILDNSDQDHNENERLFILPTSPFPIHIYLYKEENLPFCTFSTEAVRIRQEHQQWVIDIAKHFDPQSIQPFLGTQSFEVRPLENIPLYKNGLFKFCNHLINGLLPLWQEIEANFCEGFALQYPNPYSAYCKSAFFKDLNDFLTESSALKKSVFLFTLENLISRSLLSDKEEYCAMIKGLILNWEGSKTTIFSHAFRLDSLPIHDISDTKLPRFHLLTADGYLYTEPPASCAHAFLTIGSMQYAVFAAILMDRNATFTGEDLHIALNALIKHRQYQRAIQFLKDNISTLYSWDKNELKKLTQKLPSDLYLQEVVLVIDQQWEQYFDFLKNEQSIISSKKQKDRKHLLKAAQAPFEIKNGIFKDSIRENSASNIQLNDNIYEVTSLEEFLNWVNVTDHETFQKESEQKFKALAEKQFISENNAYSFLHETKKIGSNFRRLSTLFNTLIHLIKNNSRNDFIKICIESIKGINRYQLNAECNLNPIQLHKELKHFLNTTTQTFLTRHHNLAQNILKSNHAPELMELLQGSKIDTKLFLTLLKHFDLPEKFTSLYSQILINKISIIQILNEPLLWIEETNKAFDTKWNKENWDKKGIFTKKTSTATAQAIDSLLSSQTDENLNLAKKLFKSGYQTNAFTKQMQNKYLHLIRE